MCGEPCGGDTGLGKVRKEQRAAQKKVRQVRDEHEGMRKIVMGVYVWLR